MKKLVVCFLATIVITTFGVSTGFSTSYNIQSLYPILAAFGINDNGDVVGTEGGGDFYVVYNGTYTNVSLKDADGNQISLINARSINNSNQVTGTYGSNNYGGNNAFYYDGTFKNLNYPGAVATTSAAISNNGLIVGTYATSPDSLYWYYRGFTSTLGGSPHDFLYPGSTQTWLIDVNNGGAMIGTYYDDTGWHGFLFYNENNYLTLVGMDNPLGINDAGQVVGTNNGNGVLYANGQYTPLDFEGVPFDINNQGQIAGWYYGWKGQYGFIASPVPLPPTLLLLGTGLLGLGAAGWRRRRD
jgi:hypothetical protein